MIGGNCQLVGMVGDLLNWVGWKARGYFTKMRRRELEYFTQMIFAELRKAMRNLERNSIGLKHWPKSKYFIDFENVYHPMDAIHALQCKIKLLSMENGGSCE